MKKKIVTATTAALLTAALLVPAVPASATDRGGWDEETGTFTTSAGGNDEGSSSARILNHRGTGETTSIGGTTHKRAHGWTTWTGVRHYTTARMENYSGSVVYNSSGRRYGTNGTEAISPWRAATPNTGPGSARTYYGR